MNSREQFEVWAHRKAVECDYEYMNYLLTRHPETDDYNTSWVDSAWTGWQASRDCITPDWQHAPHWANWLAMDVEGQWFWFAEKPTPSTDFWINPWGKRVKEAGLTPARGDWLETLEPRP